MSKDIIETSDTQEEETEYENYCYLCRRPESIAGKLIHLPNDIYICPDCMQNTFDTFNGNGNMQFVDLSNLDMSHLNFGMGQTMPKSQKVKKKKKEENKEEPALDLKSIPAPHIMKAQLDET